MWILCQGWDPTGFKDLKQLLLEFTERKVMTLRVAEVAKQLPQHLTLADKAPSTLKLGDSFSQLWTSMHEPSELLML